MAITSGDMVLIGETDRLINSNNQIATQLFDSVSKDIFDYNSMVEAVKQAYSSDPSLLSLIESGGITRRGWLALYEHPKVQETIRRNNLNKGTPELIKKYNKSQYDRNLAIKKTQSKIDNTVFKYIKQKSNLGNSYKRTSPQEWKRIEERYLINNYEKKSIGIIFRDYNKIFQERRTLSSIKTKISRLKSEKS